MQAQEAARALAQSVIKRQTKPYRLYRYRVMQVAGLGTACCQAVAALRPAAAGTLPVVAVECEPHFGTD